MNNDLSEILDVIDLECFLDYEDVSYKRTFGSNGEQINIKTCPRCGGNSWKVYINLQTKLGNCFHGSCVGERGYNLFNFAQHLWGTSGRDTVQRLKEYAAQQGWMPKRETSSPVNMANIDVQLPDSLSLPSKNRMPVYLIRRGITPKIAKYFHLRYCKKGYYRFINSDNEERFQNYARRIIIPVFSLEGDLVTFQGRDITGDAEKKYLFPSGLPGTARFIYNAHNTIGLEHIVMCEGAFDVWSVKMAMDNDVNLRNVGQVGSFGKHLSYGSMEGDDQLGALVYLRNKGLKKVTIMWDGEAAAIRSAIDAGKQVKSVGLECDIAILPKDSDPNEITSMQIRECFYTAIESSNAKIIKEIIKRS